MNALNRIRPGGKENGGFLPKAATQRSGSSAESRKLSGFFPMAAQGSVAAGRETAGNSWKLLQLAALYRVAATGLLLAAFTAQGQVAMNVQQTITSFCEWTAAHPENERKYTIYCPVF